VALVVCLRIAGAILLLLALSHVGFSKRFHWDQELPRLSLLNRQVFVVHTFFIALVVTFMGILSLVFPETLVERSQLARIVLAGLALFWATRLVFQWFVYDRALWRGRRFETLVHFTFTVIWMYLTSVYAWALWKQFT
jgi:hypothetical protein